MWQPREPEPSTINEKTIADFTRVVEETGILAVLGHPAYQTRTLGLVRPA